MGTFSQKIINENSLEIIWREKFDVAVNSFSRASFWAHLNKRILWFTEYFWFIQHNWNNSNYLSVEWKMQIDQPPRRINTDFFYLEYFSDDHCFFRVIQAVHFCATTRATMVGPFTGSPPLGHPAAETPLPGSILVFRIDWEYNWKFF